MKRRGEKCGRAAIPNTRNETAFKKLQPTVWRLLDNDGFFVSNPGFEHCANANTTAPGARPADRF